jgi:hypothetical protein
LNWSKLFRLHLSKDYHFLPGHVNPASLKKAGEITVGIVLKTIERLMKEDV